MSDLDVIREARDYLAGLIESAVPGPWEPDGDAMLWWNDPDQPGYRLCAGRATDAPSRDLIIALRAAAPHLVEVLADELSYLQDAARLGLHHSGLHKTKGTAILARAILGTKGQDR